VVTNEPEQQELMTFLVERYLPGQPNVLSSAVARVARACADARAGGVAVRYLHSVFVADEDTCFCLFEGPSAEEVRAVNTKGDFAFDRVVAALSLPIPAAADRTSNQGVTMTHVSIAVPGANGRQHA
jgi:hypothetical protein